MSFNIGQPSYIFKFSKFSYDFKHFWLLQCNYFRHMSKSACPWYLRDSLRCNFRKQIGMKRRGRLGRSFVFLIRAKIHPTIQVGKSLYRRCDYVCVKRRKSSKEEKGRGVEHGNRQILHRRSKRPSQNVASVGYLV